MVASLGAVPSALIEYTFFDLASYTSSVASLPMPFMLGCTTPSTAWPATMASNALPPARSMRSAVRVACGIMEAAAYSVPRASCFMVWLAARCAVSIPSGSAAGRGVRGVCALRTAAHRERAKARLRVMWPPDGSVSHSGAGQEVRRASDPMERFEDLAGGAVHRDGAAVGTAHGAVGGRERAQQPLHLGEIEAHVDLDGGAAGDGRTDIAPQVVERGAPLLALGGLQDFVEHALQVGRAHRGGRGFDGECAIAEGLRLETRGVQLVGDAGVVDLLLRCELQDQGHEQALYLDPAGGALLQHLLEQDALVGHVLVDDPQPVA